MILRYLGDVDVAASGPGIGTHAETRRLVIWLLQNYRGPAVLDADGLVSTKFEGFVTVEELEAALEGVLGP